MGAAVFMIAILITILFTREYPPKEYELYHGKETEETHSTGVGEIAKDFKRMPLTMKQLGLVQFFSWFAQGCKLLSCFRSPLNYPYSCGVILS